MTLLAVVGDAERLFAVVAGPAGLAFLHLLHGGVVGVVLSPEDLRWQLLHSAPCMMRLKRTLPTTLVRK